MLSPRRNPHVKDRAVKLVSIFLVLALIITVAILIAVPSVRTGPLGIGLPAPMENFQGKLFPFSIDYPRSWVAGETPGGNRGDEEVVATILVPGRSFPHVYIVTKRFSKEDLEQVVNWGETRAKRYDDFQQIELGEFSNLRYQGQYRKYLRVIKSLNKTHFILCNDYYFLLEDNTGIILTFCADQSDWPQVGSVFQEMVESFIVTETP
jgi:hypothetical protein